MPSNRAARLLFPPARRSTRWMWRSSRTRRSATSSSPAPAGAPASLGRAARGSHWRSSRRIAPPCESAAAPSSRFSSSRMFPGKSWEQRGVGVPVERRRLPSLARREAVEEVADELRDVLAALAQRRQADLDDAQAVVEVLAELAVGDPLREARVGRREDAHVDRERAAGRRPARSRAPGGPAGAWTAARRACRRSRRERACRPARSRSGPRAPRRRWRRRARCRRARTRAASRAGPRS